MQGEGPMAGIAMYASVFEPNVARLDLWNLPASHRDGPDFLNVLRVFDIPQTVALAAEHSKVRIYQKDLAGWEFPQGVSEKLGWEKNQVQVRAIAETDAN
jgi:hypothetical protein